MCLLSDVSQGRGIDLPLTWDSVGSEDRDWRAARRGAGSPGFPPAMSVEGVQVGKVQGLLVVPFPVIGSQPSENAEAGS